MKKEIASQRVLGRDRRGREVLVAAPGQTIDRKRFEVGSTPTETEQPKADDPAAEVPGEVEQPAPEAEASAAEPPEGTAKAEKPDYSDLGMKELKAELERRGVEFSAPPGTSKAKLAALLEADDEKAQG